MPKKLTITFTLLLSFSLLIGAACDKWFGGEGESTPTATQTPEQSASNLSVHFIDVGQGDSILVDLGQYEVLIDGGDRSPGVVSNLTQYVDGTLEAVVATHPHADHIGGLIEIFDNFAVSKVWINGDTSTSKTYDDFMEKIHSINMAIYEARRGGTITVGNLTFDVLNPTDPLVDNTNDNSIVLSLKYGNVDFLFEGDAEQDAEASMITAGILHDVDILKVGHHGSNTASSQPFLDVVSPETAIYMAGVGNTYGHPHAETITKLNDIGAGIYGTDVSGTITVTTDGESYTVLTEK